MKGLDDPNYLAGYIISNIVGLLFLWAAIKKPYLSRVMFVLLFGWAAVINYSISHDKPEVYLEYANASVKWYRDFIHGWFSRNISLMVTLIAIGQAAIAIGMLLRGWWVRISCVGTIIFLLGIAPLGAYAAFPFSMTVSLAAFFILKNGAFNYLWQFERKSKKIIQA
jgi:hypothetical protein